MDKLQAMTTFVRIVERGSLTRAADALGTSLPSVVRTLAALEADVGVRLLNRTTRRIHLTDEGTFYLGQCRAILAAIGDADAALAARQVEPRGRLAITAPVLFGRRYVVPLVAAFLAQHRGVHAQALLLDRAVGLVEEGIDVAVRIGELADSTLVALPVGAVRRVVCASPGYLARHGVPRSPAELQQRACVSFAGVTSTAEWRFAAGRRIVSVTVTPRFSSNQVDAALEACERGLGVGMFLSYQVAPAIAARKLRYLLIEHELQPLPVSVVYPQAKLRSSAVRTFVDLAVATLRAQNFA